MKEDIAPSLLILYVSICNITLNLQEFLYCNKGIFTDCGIQKLPETFDELVAAVKAIKAKGYTPIGAAGKGQWLW